MVKLEAWINPTEKIDKPIELVVSDRFIDPETGEPAKWTLVPVDAGRAEEIQEACMENTTNPQNGVVTKQLNGVKYINGLTADTIKDPDLRNPELQKSLGTKGAVETLNKMLSNSEKNVLVQEINKIYKLNPAMLKDMVDDVKNGSKKAN